MESFLDVGAVEVDLGAWGLVVTLVDYAELAEWMGACLGDVIDVEARVDFEDGAVEVVELVATVVVAAGRLWKDWEWSLRRREAEIGIQIGRVITVVLAFPQLVKESGIEVDQVLPVFDVGQCNDLDILA